MGFRPATPAGAYYIMTDASALGLGDDTAAAHTLVHKAKVATVPGSSFYSRPELGSSKLRFSYSKKLATFARGRQAACSARRIAPPWLSDHLHNR